MAYSKSLSEESKFNNCRFTIFKRDIIKFTGVSEKKLKLSIWPQEKNLKDLRPMT